MEMQIANSYHCNPRHDYTSPFTLSQTSTWTVENFGTRCAHWSVVENIYPPRRTGTREINFSLLVPIFSSFLFTFLQRQICTFMYSGSRKTWHSHTGARARAFKKLIIPFTKLACRVLTAFPLQSVNYCAPRELKNYVARIAIWYLVLRYIK